MRSLALSDLHLGRTSTRLRSPEALAPLVHGFDRVLLLGDVVDTWYVTPAHARELEQRVRATCRKSGVHEVLWCRGNHDAHLMPLAEDYALLNGVLYLHGHVIYHRLRGTGPVKERIRALNARKFGPERSGSRRGKPGWALIEQAYARVPHALFVPLLWRWSVRRRVRTLVREVAREGPVRALVLGHSHSPGHRHWDQLHVFNLGGWLRNTRACGFVHEGTLAQLVRVENRHGEPYWGRVMREAELAAPLDSIRAR